MNTLLLRRSAFLGALGLGIAGDLLIRVQGKPALNVLIWAVAGTALLVWRRHVRGGELRGEVLVLLLVAVGFAAAMVWRAAEVLTVMNLGLAAGLVTFAAARGGMPWLRTAGVGEWVVGVLRVGLTMAAGPFGWIERTPPTSAPRPVPAWRGNARLALRGTALALPALIIFTALLGSADPVFASVLEDIIDISDMMPHLAFTAVLTWLTLGYLRAFDTVPASMDLPKSPGLAQGEVALALWLVNALFLLFVVIQARYLFGGDTVVEVTPGLSYAEYARRGFFELVAVAALVIPLQLAADWAAAPAEGGSRLVLRSSALVQLVLLGGIIASAVYRMRLYQDAYGLTELRLYVSLFIGWVTFVLVWLAATVLRGRRQHFAIGALVSALVCAAGLNAVNPHALIARTNIERAVSGLPYDPAYAGALSADAIPTLLRNLPRLAVADRCIIVLRLNRWIDEPVGDWRVWNYGEWRARQAARSVALPQCPRPTPAPPPARRGV